MSGWSTPPPPSPAPAPRELIRRADSSHRCRTIELAGKINADSVEDVLGSAATGEPLSAFRVSQSTP